MAIRNILLFLVVYLLSVQAGISQNAGKIKENLSFIWAECVADSEVSAADSALDALMHKLSGIISINEDEYVNRRLVLGYRNDVFKLAQRVTGKRRGDSYALCYIHKDSVARIPAQRRAKILQMLSLGESAFERLQMDVALRNFSWAEKLIASIPDADALIYRTRRGDTCRAGEWAGRQIAAILGGMKAQFSGHPSGSGQMVEINFTFNGRPVRNIDYRFYDGANWSRIYGAKDGKGVVEKPVGADASDFKVRYESESPHMMHIDAQVKEIAEILAQGERSAPAVVQGRRNEPMAIAKIDAAEVKRKILSVLAGEEEQPAKASSPAFLPVPETASYERLVEEFCRGVSGKGEFLPDSLFTPEGYDIYRKLIGYGNARLLKVGDLDFYMLGEEVYCRSIPMVFSFEGNSRKFIEDIVVTFNGEKKISNITFSLGKDAAGDIISHSDWPEEARMILISFLENYKTAYALKRLDYISSIFDDDALIITGRVLKNVKIHNELMDSRYVTLTKHNKSQYISHLRGVFSANEFINISFLNNEVLRLGKNRNMYGIQIAQDYYSTNYSDKGYLFLMVDLKDYTRPVIHVRTWQSEPDEEFGIIGPHHF